MGIVSGGFKRQQAEVQARTFLKMFARILDDRVATKADLKEIKLGFNQNMGAFREELRQDITAVREELNTVKFDIIATRQDLETFKTVVTQDIATLKHDISFVNQQMGLMEQKVDMMKHELTHDITRKIGKIMVGSVTFISGFMAILMTIFHSL